jgi:hypothetical protein
MCNEEAGVILCDEEAGEERGERKKTREGAGKGSIYYRDHLKHVTGEFLKTCVQRIFFTGVTGSKKKRERRARALLVDELHRSTEIRGPRRLPPLMIRQTN